jgi:Patatin-like phospholipase
MNIGIDLKEHKQKTRRLGREDTNSPNLKRINLALQGGALTALLHWGVLDRLLEDERIEIDGIRATSVGAMNAAVLASGLAVCGRGRTKCAGGLLALRC